MNEKDRRELERLQDLAEKERLLELAPTGSPVFSPVLEERRQVVAELERVHAEERLFRERRREPDTEWGE